MSETVSPNSDEPQDRDELSADPPLHVLPTPADPFALFGDGLLVLTERIGSELPTDYDVWLHVGASGRIVVATGKAEVGQNVRTAFAQAVAEELRTSLDSVEVLLADTDLCPFDRGTFGSRSTPITAPQVRRAAAAARETLSGASCAVLAGRRDVQIVRAGDTPNPIGATGDSVHKAGGRDFVTGAHRYAIDLAAPGMVFGAVVRAPSYGAELVAADAAEAERMEGVDVVRASGFVGVVAPSPARAAAAASAIVAQWKERPGPAGDCSIEALLRPEPIRFRRAPHCGDGCKTVDAVYCVAAIAHVPLEPRAALAQWSGGRLTVWTGTQRPFGVRDELAETFDIPADRVRVIVPDTGSGYGGKHTGDAAIEAATLSQSCGRPVKVVWTREDEFRHAYFRPAGVIDVRASVSSEGRIVDWQFHNTNSGSASIQPPYAIEGAVVEFHEIDAPVRQGSYRGLAATANTFARECHIDDLARAADIDPVQFRLQNIADPRMAQIVRACAKRFGWESGRQSPRQGIGRGLACGAEKGSYIATAVEIELSGVDGLKLRRIVAAYDCGRIVNRMHLENQIEGAIVMGVGGALFEEVRFDGWRVANPRLSEYRVPRFGDVPAVEIELVEPAGEASVGAGETPIVAVAPAISNAVFAATGCRLRNLPPALKSLTLPLEA